MYANISSHFGRFVTGKKAPERNNIGTVTRLITNPKPSMSFILEANMRPMPMNERPMRNMNINEMRNDASETSLNPIRYDKNSIVTPCISAGVTPPNILPSTIELLFTGATIISFKNPNCLSHKTDIPENIDVKSMDIPTIPGTRNIEKAALPVPGKEILFRPNPKNARKKKGIEN